VWDAVSIHAPARGATTASSCITVLCRPFQSTRPCGARPSVHARRAASRSFNPRARAGRDPESGIGNSRTGVSIHAPARGATRSSPPCRARRVVSIHAPARGATRHRGGGVMSTSVSIHAPARGATLILQTLGQPEQFQSTRPRGARQSRTRASGLRCRSFNPRARAGRDQ